MNWLGWALLSALFAGLTAVLAKAGVANIDSNLATAIRTTVVLVLTWAIVFAARGGGGFNEISRKSWIFLGLSGLATGASWLCYFRALQLGEVSKVAPIDKLSVVFAIAISFFVFHERLNFRESFGVGFIVLGVVLLAWK